MRAGLVHCDIYNIIYNNGQQSIYMSKFGGGGGGGGGGGVT